MGDYRGTYIFDAEQNILHLLAVGNLSEKSPDATLRCDGEETRAIPLHAGA